MERNSSQSLLIDYSPKTSDHSDIPGERFLDSRSRNEYAKGDAKSTPAKAVISLAEREEMFPHYEEYLLLLQEKNRLVKKLKQKDKKQIGLEKKEQGFSLYVNGANAGNRRIQPLTTVSPNQVRPKSRHTKTAGDHPRFLGLNQADARLIQQEECKERSEKDRLKTAPVKGRRKNWALSSVDLQTARGEKQKVKAPEYLTGNYKDDFESDGSEDSGNERAEIVKSMTVSLDAEISSEEDLEVDASRFQKASSKKLGKRQQMTNKKKFKSKYLKRRLENNNNNCMEYDEDEDCEQLIMSIADVKKLRKSLEMNTSIQQSLAQDNSSEDECDLESAILEEEEIEEDLVPAMESMSLEDHRMKNLLSPEDTIVLELAAPPRSNVARNLRVARKPDADDMLPPRVGNLAKPKSPKPKTPNNLQFTTASSSKSCRPLSANRKSNGTVKQDSQAEASAVLAALKAENQKAVEYNSGRSVAPSSSQTKPGSPDKSDRGQSARERRRLKTPHSPRTGNLEEENPAHVLSPSSPEKSSPSLLTNEKLSKILTQVTAMAPKQQKRLVRMLGQLEDSFVSAEELSPERNFMSNNKPGRLSDSHTDIKHSQKVTSKDKQMCDRIEVNIEILSNWADGNRVGLTEIQAYGLDKKLIPVQKSEALVHGAKDCKGALDCLFNNKYKTNKERNMWSCQYRDGHVVEISLVLHNPSPGEPFGLSKLKIWNYNKSINDLGIGIRHTRVFINDDLLFDGDIERGCGNQVFDYSTSIPVPHSNNNTDSDNRSSNSDENKHPRSISSQTGRTESGLLKLPSGPELSRRGLSPISPNGVSSAAVRTINSRTISPSPNRENRRTFRSLSRSSQSSASSNGDPQSSSRILSPAASRDEGPPSRSETRTMNYSMDQSSISRPVVGSDLSSPETDDSRRGDPLKCPPSPRARTPRKSKRMAARLSGHGSSETDSSKSHTESLSSERRPPRPPVRKSDEKPRPSSVQEFPKPQSSHDDPSAVPKLKLQPKSDQDESKKSIPSWLKQEDLDRYFESPPESRGSSRADVHISQSENRKELLDWDEDISSWPQAGIDHLSTVFDDGSGNTRLQPEAKSQIEVDEILDECTPMSRIQKNRSKWRDSQQTKLEESWGSLNLFNRSHRGRLSVDMTDDALDDYLPSKKASSKKTSQTQSKPSIPEPTVDEEEDFIIPELPYGRNFEINIMTTWGDKHYVGLTGVDIFSHTGEPVQITKITADPLDINVLPSYDKDPRVVANLTDGINRTRDDVHMWLAPFTLGGNHHVHITFQKPCRIAMMRIWNYNKSRIHSYRGAKDVEIKLDGSVIFKGEIARACGGIEGGTEAFGDTILFTVDENILEAVSKHDSAFEDDTFSDDGIEDDVPFERPSTADDGKDERPFTRASGLTKGGKHEDSPPRPQTSMVSVEGNITVFKGQKLECNFTATWGDLHYMGLTGLEVIGKDGEALPVTLKMIEATPRDVRSLPGNEKDDRTLDKLLDGSNITVSDEHMWLIPFTDGENHTLIINFSEKVLIAGLRVWNYNKSREDTYRGARILHVKIDGRVISPPDGYLVRKGLGNCFFDFAQEISFSPEQKHKNSQPQTQNIPDNISTGSSVDVPSQEYEAIQMPSGFIYQFHLLSTWGDPYYAGLNGLEFYDAEFNQIQLMENNIAAYPDSVNVLDNVTNDVRTPDKLIDGWNDTTDGRHMWLAPVLPHVVNRVYVIFDQPTTVSMIKLWNYSKTPSRGTKDFALLVDDLLVYNGVLSSVGEGARGILPTVSTQSYHTILFSDNKELLRRERHTVISKQAGGQDIQMLNDKKVVTHYSDPKKAQANKPVNQALRPKTSVPAGNKRR